MNLFQYIPMIGVNNGVWPRAIAPQAGGGPLPGYLFLRGKQADGSYVILSGLNQDASRSNLQGKAA